MWLCEYFVYFIIFGVMGWIYESIFCTIKAKKWENRGFLYGPICPIYGAGGAAITGVFDILGKNGIEASWWLVFVVGMFGSMVLEYSTSWVLEKLFNAYWWDYSDMPLNVKGRICIPFSVCFGLAGLLVVFAIAPFTKEMTSWMNPIVYELFALIFMAIIAIDTTLTVTALTDFSNNVVRMQDSLNEYMEQFVNAVAEKTIETKEAAEGLFEAKTAKKSQKELDDVRFKVGREKIDAILGSMGNGRRAALNRVKGFRNPRLEKKHMDAVNLHMRQRMIEIRNARKNSLNNKKTKNMAKKK